MSYRVDAICHAIGLLVDLKGLSQAELSRRSGIDASQISKFVNGKRVPNHRHISQLLEALEVDLLLYAFVKSFVISTKELMLADESTVQETVYLQALRGKADEHTLPPEARRELEDLSRRLRNLLESRGIR